MLQISDLNDELSETKGEVSFQWKIVDFFSLSEDAGCYYQSARFSFARSSWNLQIFPGGDNFQDESAGWISLYLRGHRLSEFSNTVSYVLGMKKADNNIEKIVENKHSFVKKNSVSGAQKFYQRSDLLRRKADLAPKGDLVISCTLKHDTVKALEVATQSMSLIELENLSTDFKDLLACKKSCDAIVKVKDREFQVHKSVLIARSSVFGSMFKTDMSEKKTGVITIADCDPDSFGDFLQYLYTGKVENMSSRNALHLYCTADKYDIKELKSFCAEYMMRNLTVENVCDVVKLGELYHEMELLSAVQIFFNKNVSHILSTNKWEALLRDDYRLANKLLKEMASKI